MLISVSATNFHSFAEKATLSFALRPRDVVQGWDRTSTSGLRLTTALAVLGANGAGKTSLIKTVAFLAWFIQDSFNGAVDAAIPFLAHAACNHAHSEFEVEADDLDGVRWRYVLHAFPDRVVHEALYRRDEKTNKYSYAFIRNLRDDGYEIKLRDFGLAESEAVKVRKNVSLLAWGKQYGAALALQLTEFVLSSNVTVLGRVNGHEQALLNAASFFAQKGLAQDQMSQLLAQWDFGLSRVEVREFETASADGQPPKKGWYPIGHHSAGEKRFELPFAFESSGTQTAFVLLSRLLPVLGTGGIAVIDELEADLHPHMIEPILKLFHDTETNPLSAQIVFTCQSPEVLKILQRTQVMFIEKIDCFSKAFRGDEISGLTNAHNLYAKYMAGALGAVPQI